MNRKKYILIAVILIVPLLIYLYRFDIKFGWQYDFSEAEWNKCKTSPSEDHVCENRQHMIEDLISKCRNKWKTKDKVMENTRESFVIPVSEARFGIIHDTYFEKGAEKNKCPQQETGNFPYCDSFSCIGFCIGHGASGCERIILLFDDSDNYVGALISEPM